MSSGKWHISLNEEDGFYGEFNSKEDAIEGGKAEGYDLFYVGQGRPPKPLSRGVFASEVIDNAIDCLEEDWCLEFAHFEPTDEQVADLERRLRDAVDQWTKDCKLEPKWFLVDDIERSK